MSVLAHVVLLSPEIPWNTGNIGRSCLAFGAKLHLVRPLGFSLAASALRRAGLDYWRHVQPEVWESWESFSRQMKEWERCFFFSAEGGKDLFTVPFPQEPFLIFGRESVGLPQDLRSLHAPRLVRIPQHPGPVRSLNLSSAVAVALAELYRQRFSGK